MSDGPVLCPRCPGSLIYDPARPFDLEAIEKSYTCPKRGSQWNGRFPVGENLIPKMSPAEIRRA